MKFDPLPELYHGPITVAQAGECMRRAMENRKKYCAEAKALLKNQQWEKSAALSFQSLEEVAKPRCLRLVLLAQTDVEIQDAWNTYGKLSPKDVTRIRNHFLLWGGHGEIDEVMEPMFPEPCFSKQWLSSSFTTITPRLSSTLVWLLDKLCSSSSTMTSVSELELLVKHLKPVWRCTGYELSKAIWACYLEAQETGVLQGDLSEWSNIRNELDPE
jgi:hypothetical protein